MAPSIPRKLAICVAFHYVEARFPYLARVTAEFRRWPTRSTSPS